MSLDLSSLWASDETCKIDLSPDTWVEIKDELDHGEEQALQAAAMRGVTRQQIADAVDDAATQDVVLMDTARLHFLKLAFYIVDWNLKDEQGRPITLPTRVDDRVKILKRLKPSVGRKLSDAIDTLREEKDREAEPIPSAGPNSLTGTTAQAVTVAGHQPPPSTYASQDNLT